MDTLKTKIIPIYAKISLFTFHYLIFLVALIAGFFLFKNIISHADTVHVFQANDALQVQKIKSIAEFKRFLRQDVQNNDLQVKILKWDFQTDQWFIKSVDNLIIYKWFVAPRYFYMYKTLPIQPISYFSGGTYELSELENFINAFVFTKRITVSQPFERTPLSLSTSLIDDFNLSCLFENKLSSATCYYYLNDFIESFFIFKLSSDYPWLKRIFNSIKGIATYKQKMCEWLSKYSLYADDQSDIMGELFIACGKTYEEEFKRTTLFMEIQKWLDGQSFDKSSYKDPILNEYKLLSYQQQIYQDFLANRTDTYKITIYLDFINELLKKNNIDIFYKDEIYRFNNNYLASTIEKIAYQTTKVSQNVWIGKLTPLLSNINSLNAWDAMLGLSWLLSQIQNISLIRQQWMTGWSIITLSPAEKIQKQLQNIPYITVERQSISETTIDLMAYMKFPSFSNTTSTTSKTLKAHIIMEYKNDMLIVKTIELQDKPEMNNVIKSILVIQDFSIGELYSYISKNLVFYEQTNPTISTDFCPVLKDIKNISVVSCSPTASIVEKNSMRYEFGIKNNGLESVIISDKLLENAIKSSYSTIVADNYSIMDSIAAILNYEIPSLQGHEGTTDAILVFERIQQYMGIKSNDIANSGWIILVDLTVWWINFIVNYTLKTNALGPRYFKDILTNQNKPYMVQNLNLLLDAANQKVIDAFVIDPLTAIKNEDFTAWQNYQQLFWVK